MLDEGNFYTDRNGEKADLCKKCLTMHVDNYNPETFLWILQKMDVPYIESEWTALRDKVYARDPFGVTGMSIIGRYLSKMRLTQYKKYHWGDQDKIAAEINKQEESLGVDAQKEIMEQQYQEGVISEAQYKTYLGAMTPVEPNPLQKYQQEKMEEAEKNNPYKGILNEDVQIVDETLELTSEDKTYLAMKWGLDYSPSQWIKLEKKFTEMQRSFDIQDSDSISTLVLLCKTDLKMNEAIDMGDFDGFHKLSRVSESLRKTAKFTAAQNKEEKGDFVDSIGQLVAYCEKEGGFIPRFATDVPQDTVDVTIQDMKNYNYKLVTQDLGFGQQIETALKKIQIQNEFELSMDNPEDEELTDKDIIDYNESIEHDKEFDALIEEGIEPVKKSIFSDIERELDTDDEEEEDPYGIRAFNDLIGE